MSSFKSSLIAALLATALTAGGLYFVRGARNREAATLRHANDRMRFEASRRRHAQTAAAVSMTPAASSTAAVNAAPAAGPASASPPENYRNEGRATPVATLQTYAWACDRGDTRAIVTMLHIDEAARAKAEAYRATLPEKIRGQWPSVDEMAAALLTADVMQHPFPVADILDTATIEPIRADRVLLRLPGTPKDRIEFQQTASGWSYVITEAAVDAYLVRATTRPAAP